MPGFALDKALLIVNYGNYVAPKGAQQQSYSLKVTVELVVDLQSEVQKNRFVPITFDATQYKNWWTLRDRIDIGSVISDEHFFCLKKCIINKKKDIFWLSYN